MKKIFLGLLLIITYNFALSQKINDLDRKWAFSGSRTTFFSVRNDSLFLSLINDHSVHDFEQFYSGDPNMDSLTLFPCQTTLFGNKIMVVVEVKQMNKKSIMSFIYSTEDSSVINYIGDVYYGDKKVPNANENCNLQVPYCINKLYSIADIEKIKKLNPISEITKKEVLKVFKMHSEVVKSRCNKCYEGFPGAEINEIIIQLGYNPVIKKGWNDTYVYDVSGFDNMLKIYEEDSEVKNAYRAYFLPFINNENASNKN